MFSPPPPHTGNKVFARDTQTRERFIVEECDGPTKAAEIERYVRGRVDSQKWSIERDWTKNGEKDWDTKHMTERPNRGDAP